MAAGVLVIAAVVALVVAFTTGGSGSSAQATTPTAAVATPLWSVRRVPEPVVEAVGAQHLQSALDAAAPGDGTCFVVNAGDHTLATHGADTPLIGASTQKLLVAAAALAVLGPDSTFQTRAV
ncbi:MAG TPA: D-alanyl-D-alanine carboxypeptidase, partial [Acidimicrobiia bacterium]|nr:D-alanyl-D-alanine carboxypeptidase [Acidimicrobiia bacterium]